MKYNILYFFYFAQNMKGYYNVTGKNINKLEELSNWANTMSYNISKRKEE